MAGAVPGSGADLPVPMAPLALGSERLLCVCSCEETNSDFGLSERSVCSLLCRLLVLLLAPPWAQSAVTRAPHLLGVRWPHFCQVWGHHLS